MLFIVHYTSGEVSFAAGLTLKKSCKGFAFSAIYYLSLGVFLASRQATPPAFRAELLAADGAVNLGNSVLSSRKSTYHSPASLAALNAHPNSCF
ncbi:MAG: hypothetical protein H2172_02450 [Opitutus sp.]|nr:hypothetical protein [Opitutus sp.]MCS6248676.1 hypothetical protein [Opitutus sp.]MCS6273908.1 hypothetical protein [Opitutus sp.]MCS6277686.1 hypothetical protein [Opitutus sp.]MCS6299209.1 hypothetical protein [Opitutus sp.]